VLQLITPYTCNFWSPGGLVQPLAAKLGGVLQPFTLNNVTGDLKVQKNRCGRDPAES